MRMSLILIMLPPSKEYLTGALGGAKTARPHCFTAQARGASWKASPSLWV